MPRCLVMSERTVGEAEREAYLQSLAVRRELAAAASVHFWTFEHETTRGRFLEFVEGASRAAVERALESGVGANNQPDLSDLWQELRSE